MSNLLPDDGHLSFRMPNPYKYLPLKQLNGARSQINFSNTLQRQRRQLTVTTCSDTQTRHQDANMILKPPFPNTLPSMDPFIGHFSPESNEHCGQAWRQKEVARFWRTRPQGLHSGIKLSFPHFRLEHGQFYPKIPKVAAADRPAEAPSPRGRPR